MTRVCLFCKKDISTTHRNRKYCSNSCYEKARYKKNGQRSSGEQRSVWYFNRKKQKGYIEKLRQQACIRNKKIKEFIAQYKLNAGCKDCGYKKHHTALEFDHINGKKEFNVCFAKSISQAKKEISKCDVVCANCHRIRTYNRLYPYKPDIFEETYEEV